MAYQLHKQNQGFSLLQVSLLIAVAGIILASVLPGGELGGEAEKQRVTRERMEKIEQAARNFMAANLRRPCPADGSYAQNTANFGLEAANNGRCTGGTPAANFSETSAPTATGTTTSGSAIVTSVSAITSILPGQLVTAAAGISSDTHVASIDSATQITLDKTATASGSRTLTFASAVAGVVPTKTLGLPDEYMIDGYGRRMSYAVDIRATDRTLCRNLQNSNTKGSLAILDTSGGNTADNVMWALLSYGKDGYGAFSLQGTSVANRLNPGVTDTDSQINAFVNNSTSFASTWARSLVKKARTATFDDMVWTLESTKNTCCVGKVCNAAARIDGVGGEFLGGSFTGTGDINGDGIPDIVTARSAVNTVRVIFGKKSGWATPPSYLLTSAINNSTGITITNNSSLANFGSSAGVGDINGDGYDDILIGSGDGTASKITLFLGSATPVDTNTSTLTNNITFPVASLNSTTSPFIAVGDFTGDGKKDLLAVATSTVGYVIYGAAGATPFGNITADTATLRAATNGFKVTTSNSFSGLSGVGNLNNDFNTTYNIDDIFIMRNTGNILYTLWGRLPASWDADKNTAGVGTAPDEINVDTQVTAGGTKAITFTGGGAPAPFTVNIADLNGDGIPDLLVNNSIYFNVYYGKVGGWASLAFSTASSYDGTNGFRIDVTTNKPSWISNPMTRAVVGDVNNDGKNDIVLVDMYADNNGTTDSGSDFVVLQPAAGWPGFGNSFALFGTVFDATGTGLPLNGNVSLGFRIDGYSNSDQAKAKAVVDINNDGKNDLIINRTGGNGSIYILFGRKNVPWDQVVLLNDFN